MKILHVINSLNFGGAERLLYDLALNMCSEHPDISVEICTLFDDSSWGEALKRENVAVYDLNVGKWNAAKAIYRLRKLITRNGYDIVHAHLWPSLYYVSAVSLLEQRPVYIYTEHSTNNRRRGYSILRWLESKVYSNYDAVVANSPETKKDLSSWVPNAKTDIHVVKMAWLCPTS